MNNEFKHIEAFEAYYNNELAANEKIAFEDRLESDADFNNEYSIYLELQKAITELGDDKLKSNLEEHHQQYLTYQNFNTNDLKFKIYISGLILFLTVMCSLILLHPEETSKQRIEARKAHVEFYNNRITTNTIEEVQEVIIDTTFVPVKKQNHAIKPLVKNDTLYYQLPLKKYEFPNSPKYQMDNASLHLYGVKLDKNAHIRQEQNNLYLINKTNTYPIGETTTTIPLEKVSKRMYESAITKNKTQALTTISHIVSEIDAQTDSIELLIINSEKLTGKYTFDGKKLILKKPIEQMQLVLIEQNHYIITENNIYPIEIGEYFDLNPSTTNEFKPTKTALKIITETIERNSELQNSN